MINQAPKPNNWIRYYDDRNIMDEIYDSDAFVDSAALEIIANSIRIA